MCFSKINPIAFCLNMFSLSIFAIRNISEHFKYNEITLFLSKSFKTLYVFCSNFLIHRPYEHCKGNKCKSNFLLYREVKFPVEVERVNMFSSTPK